MAIKRMPTYGEAWVDRQQSLRLECGQWVWNALPHHEKQMRRKVALLYYGLKLEIAFKKLKQKGSNNG